MFIGNCIIFAIVVFVIYVLDTSTLMLDECTDRLLYFEGSSTEDVPGATTNSETSEDSTPSTVTDSGSTGKVDMDDVQSIMNDLDSELEVEKERELQLTEQEKKDAAFRAAAKAFEEAQSRNKEEKKVSIDVGGQSVPTMPVNLNGTTGSISQQLEASINSGNASRLSGMRSKDRASITHDFTESGDDFAQESVTSIDLGTMHSDIEASQK